MDERLGGSPQGRPEWDELGRAGLDAPLLISAARAIEPTLAPLARAFFERANASEVLHAYVAHGVRGARFEVTLGRYVRRLFAVDFSPSPWRRIGRAHVRIGVPAVCVPWGIALLRAELSEAMIRSDCDLTVERLVHRRIDLASAAILEAYEAEGTARIERAQRAEVEANHRRLFRSEQRYLRAVELARVLIVGIDEKGRILLFNREAERATGLPRSEALSRSFVDLLIADEMKDEHGAKLAGLFSRRSESLRMELESVMPTRTGRLRDVAWLFAATPEGDDEVAAFAIGQDVTDAKALAERTRVTEKLAAVGTLAAGLAHEIRNPLNGAHLHVSFLERAIHKRGGDSELLDSTRIVRGEIQRLADLVTEFLDFARPRPVAREPLSVRKLCEKLRDLVYLDAQAVHVNLVMDLTAKDVVIEADEPKLEQVFLNLLRNAFESLAPLGGGTVIWRVRRQPRHVVLEVEDDGPGLPSPDAPIFDAFYSTKPQGTGLGLAVTHRIVTDHGGTTEVESRPGRMLFRVTLPLTAGREMIDGAPFRASAAPGKSASLIPTPLRGSSPKGSS